MTTTALVNLTAKLAARLDMGDGSGLMDTLKATAFKGPVTDAQMTALMIVANQYCLNPWTKEIYAFPDKNNGIIPVVGVDGWSRIINENPNFDGMEFRQSDSMKTMDGAMVEAPEWMECLIYRKDRSRPTSVREYLDEVYRAPFKGKDGYSGRGPWQTHTKRFLRHKAMIQCARLAFGYVGIYDQDEAERIVDMGSVQEAKKTPTQIAQTAAENSRPPRTSRHDEIVKNLEVVAKAYGFDPFKEEWSKLSKEDRSAIGTLERDRIALLANSSTVESRPSDNRPGN